MFVIFPFVDLDRRDRDRDRDMDRGGRSGGGGGGEEEDRTAGDWRKASAENGPAFGRFGDRDSGQRDIRYSQDQYGDRGTFTVTIFFVLTKILNPLLEFMLTLSKRIPCTEG